MQKYSLRSVLLLVIVVMGVSLSWRPLAVPDEGRYLGVAAAMWHSQDWIVPRLDGLPYFHKPPLFYWLAGLFYGLSGETAWVGRLVSWLGALMGLLSLAWLQVMAAAADQVELRQRLREQAKWSVLVLALQPLWLIGAQYANLDMLVAGLISAAICALARWALRPDLGGAPWLALLAIGLGVLAKGLIGLVLPVAVIMLWLVWERRWSQLLRMMFWPGWLLLPVLILPWFLLVERQHPGFLHYFVVVQHFKRFVGHTFNNVMPFWFFPAILLLLMLPWSPMLVAQAVGYRRRAAAATPDELPPRLERLAWAWLAVIVLFFSLPASKLVGYILPAVPAAALLMGAFAARSVQAGTSWLRRGAPWLAGLSVLVCLGSVAAIARLDHKGNGELAQRLQSQLQPGDQLVYWSDYFFDLALLLHRREPVTILSSRLKMGTFTGDGWEQELLDAAEFDLPQGRRLLRLPEQWAEVRCAAPRTWLIARQDERAAIARLTAGLPPTLGAGKTDAYLVTAGECPAAAQHEGR